MGQVQVEIFFQVGGLAWRACLPVPLLGSCCRDALSWTQLAVRWLPGWFGLKHRNNGLALCKARRRQPLPHAFFTGPAGNVCFLHRMANG